MKDLIVVRKQVIGNGEVNAVDARELHVFLESQQQFADWMKNRIKKYDFTEGLDFIAFHNSIKADNTYINTKEYTLSLDMAKQLAMVERNDKGKQARMYFIDCEKKLKEVSHKTDRASWFIEGRDLRDMLVDILNAPEHIVASEVVKHVRMIGGPDMTNVVGLLPCTQNISENEVMLEPTELGKLFNLSAIKMNLLLCEWGWHERVGGGWEPTAEGSKYCQKGFWQKPHKTGYNLRWNIEAVKDRYNMDV